MSTSNRDLRLAAFKQRVASEPGALHKAPEAGRYIPVNPMSDEIALLAEIGLSPADCVKVDCYWNPGDDVHFVQVNSAAYAPDRPPGVYARKNDDTAYMLNIVVVVSDAAISRPIVEASLDRARIALRTEPELGQGLTPLG